MDMVDITWFTPPFKKPLNSLDWDHRMITNLVMGKWKDSVPKSVESLTDVWAPRDTPKPATFDSRYRLYVTDPLLRILHIWTSSTPGRLSSILTLLESFDRCDDGPSVPRFALFSGERIAECRAISSWHVGVVSTLYGRRSLANWTAIGKSHIPNMPPPKLPPS